VAVKNDRPVARLGCLGQKRHLIAQRQVQCILSHIRVKPPSAHVPYPKTCIAGSGGWIDNQRHNAPAIASDWSRDESNQLGPVSLPHFHSAQPFVDALGPSTRFSMEAFHQAIPWARHTPISTNSQWPTQLTSNPFKNCRFNVNKLVLRGRPNSRQQVGCMACQLVIVRIPRHPATQSTNIRPPVPRSSGQAVGAQRRRFALLV